ncbi:hypothetical protein MBOT_35500 [Mycobacterium botniense]|uniref:Uncharacterized protein n=1 Tax=Mycobacterium botniense TaxID=84962 RepID=A0A7I9Y281_9MYCO|nr:hypothetical protein MBOT_35500 [Mycobacterium botniense]
MLASRTHATEWEPFPLNRCAGRAPTTANPLSIELLPAGSNIAERSPRFSAALRSAAAELSIVLRSGNRFEPAAPVRSLALAAAHNL